MYVLLMVMRICGRSHPGADRYLAYIAERGGFVLPETVVRLGDLC